MNRREIEQVADVKFRRALDLKRRRHDVQHSQPGRDDVLILLVAEMAAQMSEMNQNLVRLIGDIRRESKRRCYRLKLDNDQ